MAAFRKFEDIKAWQKSRVAANLIYQITSHDAFRKDFALRDQIRRSGISVMANIAEGFGRRSNREFSNFLNIAHGSAAETQSHLYIASDLRYIDRVDFENVYNLYDENSKMIMSLNRHLMKSS